MEEAEQYSADLIVRIIKFNKKLMHLDLSHCGLTTLMFNRISNNWNKTMTLVSCHLNGNPFIWDIENKDELVQKLKAKPLLDHSKLPEFPELQQIVAASDNNEMLHLAQIQLRQKQLTTHLDVHNHDINTTFMLQRKLGHKKEIPNAGQWEIILDQQMPMDIKDDKVKQSDKPRPQYYAPRQINQECWFCKNHQVTVIFWSPIIQFYMSQKYANLQNKYAGVFAKHLLREGGPDGAIKVLQDNADDVISIKSESDQVPPTIYMEGNYWQPKEMVDVFDLVKAVDSDNQFRTHQPDVIEFLKAQEKIPEFVTNY